ncbi:DUF4249 domain-containing protein [Reichenbachiella sp. MALMAid0571]|uniref:DUF4249 domain-containing protein n=1 Tax=Reichenbachiella sp. MALMAid0571 TaxID=3143939 RepID=UPI0032DE5246
MKHYQSHITRWKRNTLAFCVFILAVCCEDSINLDLPLGAERIVISGWITNLEEPYTVSVSRTVGFNDQTTDPGISGAEVYVLDRFSNRFDFVETNESGTYHSNASELVGTPGNAYVLHVNISGGSQYASAWEVLNAVSDLDTVFFDTAFDPELPITDPNAKVYFTKGAINDIPNVRNFYRWKMYINDTLKNKPEEIVIFDDKFTNGNVFETKVTDVFLKSGDKLKLEQWSLSQRAFDYYSLLISQISSDQIGPSTPPSTVKGNIFCLDDQEELVLGYFGASEITVKYAEVTP